MKSPSDPDLLVNVRAEAETMLNGAQTLDGLRIAWTQVWRAFDENPPDRLTRLKNKRKAQIELGKP